MAPEVPQPNQGVMHGSGRMCGKHRALEQALWGCGGAESLDRLGQLFPDPLLTSQLVMARSHSLSTCFAPAAAAHHEWSLAQQHFTVAPAETPPENIFSSQRSS